MLDPKLVSGIASPISHPSTPVSSSTPSPTSPIKDHLPMLMELQILAFAEHGIGSELESL